MSFSMEQLVIDNDIIGLAKYAKQGIAVTPETLACQAIRDVGIGHDFLGYPDTLAHVDLPSHTAVFDRNMNEEWVKQGAKDAVAVAHEKVVDILAHHQPTPISAQARKEIDRIIAEADRKLAEVQSMQSE